MQSTVSYRAGSTLRTQRVIARQAWISARVCRRCGALEVRWNGRVVRRISLRSRRSRVRTQQVLRFPNMRRGVITLRVVGPRRRAEITGLAVSPFPPA